MSSCTPTLHSDYLHLLALSRLHLDLCLSQFSTISFPKSTLQSLSFYDLTTSDHLFPLYRNVPWRLGKTLVLHQHILVHLLVSPISTS